VLKSPEYAVFTNPASAQEPKYFKLRAVEPPDGFAAYFDKVVLVEKLREVRALIGFILYADRTGTSSSNNWNSRFNRVFS
jgi:hypothetical protein